MNTAIAPMPIFPPTERTERATLFAAIVEGRLKQVGSLFTVKLAVQTTGGVVRTLQQLQIVPVSAPASSPVLVGHINTKEQTAELRGLEHVRALLRQRAEGALEIDGSAYAAFLEEAKALLTDFGFAVSIAVPTRESLRCAPPRPELDAGEDGVWARCKAWVTSPARPTAIAFAAMMLTGVVVSAILR